MGSGEGTLTQAGEDVGVSAAMEAARGEREIEEARRSWAENPPPSFREMFRKAVLRRHPERSKEDAVLRREVEFHRQRIRHHN